MTAKTKARARGERDAGICAAAEHADSVDPSWSFKAYAWLCQYAYDHQYLTCIPVTRQFPSPTTNKAYGSLFVKAQRDGIIEKVGYVENPERHNSPTPQYRSLIWKGD